MITIQERSVGSIRLRLVRQMDPCPALPGRFYMVLQHTADPRLAAIRRYDTTSQRLAELWFMRAYENESTHQFVQMEECIA
jgi:hypothetical protein